MSKLQKFWNIFEPLQFATKEETAAMSLNELKAYEAQLEADRKTMCIQLNLAKNDDGEYSPEDLATVRAIKTQVSLYLTAVGHIQAQILLLRDQRHKEDLQRQERDKLMALEREQLKAKRLALEAAAKLSLSIQFMKAASRILDTGVYQQILAKAKIAVDQIQQDKSA